MSVKIIGSGKLATAKVDIYHTGAGSTKTASGFHTIQREGKDG